MSCRADIKFNNKPVGSISSAAMKRYLHRHLMKPLVSLFARDLCRCLIWTCPCCILRKDGSIIFLDADIKPFGTARGDPSS